MDLLQKIIQCEKIYRIGNNCRTVTGNQQKETAKVVCVSVQHEMFPKIIRQIRSENPICIIGAVDVMTPEQCREAAEHGVNFIITPGIDRMVLEWCRENGVFAIPGCLTPTEIMQCMDMGYKAVCCYPPESRGGVPALAMVKEHFPEIAFIAYGGITEETAQEYRVFGAADAVIIR